VLYCRVNITGSNVRFIQLFVKGVGLMFYLRYLCLVAYKDVQYILCFVFVLFFFLFGFSELSIFDCPFGIL